MNEAKNGPIASVGEVPAGGLAALESLFAAAQPGAVFSPPVVAGAYTVITASEVAAGGGFGFGHGFGPARGAHGRPGAEASTGEEAMAGGGGMGGGGGSKGRPVAAIVIGPDGVQVKPIVDVTALAIAGITTWAAMAGIFGKIRRARKI